MAKWSILIYFQDTAGAEDYSNSPTLPLFAWRAKTVAASLKLLIILLVTSHLNLAFLW